MEALYDRIVTNEIKMKDESLLGGGGADAAKAAAAASAGWLDTIMNLLPGRAKAASTEPNDEAIRRTHDYLRWAWQGGMGCVLHWGPAGPKAQRDSGIPVPQPAALSQPEQQLQCTPGLNRLALLVCPPAWLQGEGQGCDLL